MDGKVIRAKFKGKDKSMGFSKGSTYIVKTTVHKHKSGLFGGSKMVIVLFDMDNTTRYCFYSSVESMLDNWEIIGLETIGG